VDIKQNPFSLYDFLGYFTPGSIFLYAALAIQSHAGQDSEGIKNSITDTLSFDKAEIYIPFVLAAYTCGHILSFISSFTIEQYSIRTAGYPSKYLLDVDSKILKEKFSLKRLLNFRLSHLFIALAILPISAMDLLIGQWLGFRSTYTKPLDKNLVESIRNKISSLMREQGGLINPPQGTNAANSDFFRIVYHYCVENAPNHFPKMQNYVAIYGFLRTLTLLSVLLFWIFAWHSINHPAGSQSMITIFTISLLLPYLLYMAFFKFYRRFSLEALMALIAVYKTEPIKLAVEKKS
jgi:hypothetical protein